MAWPKGILYFLAWRCHPLSKTPFSANIEIFYKTTCCENEKSVVLEHATYEYYDRIVNFFKTQTYQSEIH